MIKIEYSPVTTINIMPNSIHVMSKVSIPREVITVMKENNHERVYNKTCEGFHMLFDFCDYNDRAYIRCSSMLEYSNTMTDIFKCAALQPKYINYLKAAVALLLYDKLAGYKKVGNQLFYKGELFITLPDYVSENNKIIFKL